MKRISMIIPAYNEAEVLAGTIRALTAWEPLPGTVLGEIIVVDDGSDDGTGELAGTVETGGVAVRVLRNAGNRGKGYSVRRGIMAAAGDIIGFTDADLAYDPSQYNAFIEPLLAETADFCVGSRHLRADSGLDNYSARRYLSTHVFRVIVRLLGLTPVSDSQCGVKFFTAAAGARIFPRIRQTGFTFDVEMLYLCRRQALRIVEIPVIMRKQSHSTVRLRRQAPRMFMDLLRIRFARRREIDGAGLPSKDDSLQ